MGKCEQCYDNPQEFDGLVDGAYKRVCKKCALLDNVVVMTKPKQINIKDVGRSTVREVLMRMSGYNRPKLKKAEATLDDLRRVKHIKEAEQEDVEFPIKDFDKKKIKNEKSWFNWFNGKREKDRGKAVSSISTFKRGDLDEGEILGI